MGTKLDVIEQQLRTKSEKAWTTEVLDALRKSGYTAWHITHSRRTVTERSGHRRLVGDKETKGWVDVWAVKRMIDGGMTVLFLELKKCAAPGAEAKQLSDDQADVLELLTDLALLTATNEDMHILTGVLRPRDHELLRRLCTNPWNVEQMEMPSC